jgi:ribosomal protein S8
MKKCKFVFVLVTTCLLTAVTSGTSTDSPSEVEHLRGEVERLKQEVSRLQEELTEQTKENKRLKALCEQAGVDLNTNDVSNKPFSFESSELQWNEKNNLMEILYKLKILAIENDTTDTKSHHNRINKLKSHCKSRLELFDLIGKHGWLKDPKLFDQLLTTQEQTHQRKLEYIKLNMIKAFDEVEEAEHEYYEGLQKATIEEVAKRSPTNAER